ncbi:MAG: peptidase M17 [Bacteroidetes bacterium SW_9_63_38]|nr:MAG: peptidase M17 [Bacteroidetes bacterium SW_9_63_38]
MIVSTTTTAPVDLDADLLLLPFTEEPAPPLVDALASTLGAVVARAAGDFTAAEGDVRVAYPGHATAPRVALLGLGPAADLHRESLRIAAAAGSEAAREHEADTVVSLLPNEGELDDDVVAQGLVEGFVLGAYQYRAYKTDDAFDEPSSFLLRVREEHDAGAVEAGVQRGHRLAAAATTARDLVNRSPDDKTAEAFADLVVESGAEHGYDVDVWNEAQIRDEGMGGLLAVNRGSFDPPTFSVLEWGPDEVVNDRPVVVVGKGVMFDTGGLSLKNTKGSMDKMKSDMGGAAAVVGLFEALAALEVPLHVVGLVPATDNRPGRTAYVPGDVITMHSGATVEVMNTDAEGRLLLADALSYATDAYDPTLMIDVATLTGSCIAALGTQAAGGMASETDAAAERLYAIQRAGERTGERVHPLPMYEDYEQHLDSAVADVTNVGGRGAGAVTAGKFLEHFVGAPWLHLDVAGPAFLDESDAYRPKGGTGFGVRLLATYLENYVATRKQA